MNNNDIMIIPDVHGRTFWKEAKNFEGKIIFLGDYVDPYTGLEDITKKEALENFKEVIEFAKENKNVTLLVGNHDMTYFFTPIICECRTDWDSFLEIKNLFRDNASMFKLAHYEKHNGKDILFTHACLHDKWLEDLGCIEKTYKSQVDFINEQFKKVIDTGYDDRCNFIHHLSKVSYQRGGWGAYGSIVWGDILECAGMLKDETKALNIFGHTQLNEDGAYVILGNCICIDSRKIFSLDDLIEKYENGNEK